MGNINVIYRTALQDLLHWGQEVSPRGQKTIELVGSHYTLMNPAQNLLVSPARKLNYPFMVAEWLWIMFGANDVGLIKPYNQNIANFSDDGQYFSGAYGPKFIEQLPYVLRTLLQDPSSRQAVMTFWRERPGPSKDVPCTVSLQFLIRAGALYLIVNMRSNDVWLGFPYDVFTFTMIQRYVALLLGCNVGSYHHVVGSFHLYSQHVDLAKEVLREQVSWHPSIDLGVEIPEAFRATSIGLPLLVKSEISDPKNILAWVLPITDELPEPWGTLLRLLAYRFHRDKTYLPQPFLDLLAGRVDQ